MEQERKNKVMASGFDTSIRDSQSTRVLPIEPCKFDFDRYRDYELSKEKIQGDFLDGKERVLVYRRVRADGVFYDKCRDYKESLELQLGALNESMGYEADIVNFLEPWYGIGYIASAFGADYCWSEGQAPSVKPVFHSSEEILKSTVTPIHQTDIGKYILEMEEYFLDKTKGMLPMSFCDVQSPLNMLSYLMPVTDLFMEVYDDPEGLSKAAVLTADLLLEFLEKQKELIGDRLAMPGHGFASSRKFRGIGMSNDNSIMLDSNDYKDIFQPADEIIGEKMNGLVYHSCGNWGSKIPLVLQMKDIVCADGAFSVETDPSPNDPELFAKEFAGNGVILNARVVGDGKTCREVFDKLIKNGQRLIAVTYCKDKKEQREVYDFLHRR